MKKAIYILFGMACAACTQAAVLHFDLSPPGTTVGGGLSALNEVIYTPSAGTGNETGAGILFNTSTLTLTFNLGYGSAAGFHDLSGPAFAWLLHGPAPPGETAPALFNLASFHTFAADPLHGGTMAGSLNYTPEQSAALLAGLDYINFYTPANLGGEIRGQLVLVPEPGSMLLMCVSGVAFWGLTRRRSRSEKSKQPK